MIDYKTYLDKLDRIDILERAVLSMGDEFREYKPRMIELLNQFREIYDMELIESGSYPTF